jgi:hypothetical protein
MCSRTSFERDSLDVPPEHLRDETLKRGSNVTSRLVAAAEEKVAEKAE